VKTIASELADHLAEEVTTLCRIMTIRHKDGTIYRFTDLDREITVEGNKYNSYNGFSATAVQTNINSAASNMDLSILFDDAAIDYASVERGMYDDAPVVISEVNWSDPDSGTLLLISGTVRNIRIVNRLTATFNIYGQTGKLTRPICEQYTASCRAVFGDARCKVDRTPYTETITITSVTNPQRFTSDDLVGAEANLYRRGIVKWLTGPNVGTYAEVNRNSPEGVVSLMYPPPFPASPGDTAHIIRGCANTVQACIAYGNLANYRGEPYVPGDQGIK
jgi:uncharacterized phage protein (TIGR02218 family)